MTTLISRTVTVQCFMGATVGASPDVFIDDVISVKWSAGFDVRVAQAEVVCATLPPGANFWTRIELRVGATPSDETPTVATRFNGYIYDFSYGLFPRTVTLSCRGRLVLLENIPPFLDVDSPDTPVLPDAPLPDDEADPAIAAMDDPDIQGVPMGGLTDADQVRFVLNACGLGDAYDPDDIGGTSHVLGVETADDAPDPGAPLPDPEAPGPQGPSKNTKGSKSQFVWRWKQSGASYVDALETVTLGFRLFERVGGEIVRWQISPRPSAATITGPFLFQEGVDIEKGSSTHSTKEARNRVRCTGHDNGTGKKFATATAGHPHPVPGLTYVSDDFSSPLIERSENSDPGTGLSCREVAQWRLAELNHVQLSVDFTTPLDTQISPGDTIAIYAPDRLDVAQNFWVLHVDGEVSSAGAFSQTLKCRAPAAEGAGGSPYGVGGIGF